MVMSSAAFRKSLFDYELVTNFEGSGVPAFKYDLNVFFAANPLNSDAATWTFIRRDPAGGTPGNTNSTIRAIQTTNAATASYSWTVLGIMENYATGGQNVGGYFIGRKHSTGPTWGGLFEVIETTPVNNPVNGTVAAEIDVSANGTDSVFPYARVGVDLAVRKYNSGGVDCEAGWGFRIQNGGDANSLVRIGFGLTSGMRVVNAFDCSLGTVLNASLVMAETVPISFDAGYQHLLKYTPAGGLDYNVAGVLTVRLGQDGTIRQKVLTVATLGAPDAGKRAVVNDSNAAMAGNFGAIVAGGGANLVPVIGDNTNWRIG